MAASAPAPTPTPAPTPAPARSSAPTEWAVCGKCRNLVYRRRLVRQLWVCPERQHHERLPAGERIAQLLDPGSVTELPHVPCVSDPLEFVDVRPYRERLAEARAASGLDEAVVCVRGRVEGRPVIAAVMDFGFLGGSLGVVVGERITRAAEVALAERSPLLLVSASGGARMQEGVLSLMQMAKTSQALRRLDEAGILTVSLVTDPTYGGVAASFATLCDVIIAEPQARLGFAGPRVIQQTIRQSLPENFQRAESLLANGLIDDIQPRSALRVTLSRLLRAAGTPADPVPTPAAVVGDALVRDPDQLAEADPWLVVQRARDLQRPTTLDYIGLLLEEFHELHGDRVSGDCPAIVAGVGRFDGRPVVVIGHQKGHDVAEVTARSFGMASPAGYRKAARVMRLAAKLGMPVITLIDTPGAYPGVAAETGGQAVAIAENLRLLAGLRVPVVAVITGEGGSGGALALAVANRVLMFANAVYSVISPEGCAAILWKAPAKGPAAAAALRPHARELLREGVVDAVVPEPDGGTQRDPQAAAAALRAALQQTLAELAPLSPEGLVSDRWARFRRFGVHGGAGNGEGAG